MTGPMSPAAIRRRREDAGLSRRVVAERAQIPLSRVWAAEREGGKGVDDATMNSIMKVIADAMDAMENEEEIVEQPESPSVAKHKLTPKQERQAAVGIVITKLAEAAEAPQTVGRLREVMRAAVAELREISDKALSII